MTRALPYFLLFAALLWSVIALDIYFGHHPESVWLFHDGELPCQTTCAVNARGGPLCVCD